MAAALRRAGVTIVGGDTKVVERGKADGMYITTTGIGEPMTHLTIDARSVRPGDKILLSGPIGDHGITILLARGELDLEADLSSDTRWCCLWWKRWPGRRRPESAGCAILPEAELPPLSMNLLAIVAWGSCCRKRKFPCATRFAVPANCLDWIRLHIANEGQFLAVVAPEYADVALNALHRTEGGEDALIIGEVRDGACLRRACDHAIWRQPDCGHACRRSSAANLLGTIAWKRA